MTTSTKIQTRRKKLGIALGSGGSRGFAHLGILLALNEIGIQPDIVTGASVGAIIGAFYASGKLDLCEKWAASLSRKQALKLMDFQWFTKGGFVKGNRIIQFFIDQMGDVTIESLPKPFLAVATNLLTGQEVWLKEGSLANAIRASMAFPGFLPSYYYRDQWLVDGGLVNPVPISPCRAIGADYVIAVDLNQHLVGRLFQKDKPIEQPGILDTMFSSINIMQDRITRSRVGGDPPDWIVAPRLGHVAMLNFNSVADSVAEGRRCIEHLKPVFLELRKALG